MTNLIWYVPKLLKQTGVTIVLKNHKFVLKN